MIGVGSPKRIQHGGHGGHGAIDVIRTEGSAQVREFREVPRIKVRGTQGSRYVDRIPQRFDTRSYADERGLQRTNFLLQVHVPNGSHLAPKPGARAAWTGQ